MIARFLAAAMFLVDAAGDQAVGQLGREQRVIDAKAVVTLPGAGLIVPLGPYSAAGIVQRDGIGPASGHEPGIGIARFGLHQRVVGHGAR